MLNGHVHVQEYPKLILKVGYQALVETQRRKVANCQGFRGGLVWRQIIPHLLRGKSLALSFARSA